MRTRADHQICLVMLMGGTTISNTNTDNHDGRNNDDDDAGDDDNDGDGGCDVDDDDEMVIMISHPIEPLGVRTADRQHKMVMIMRIQVQNLHTRMTEITMSDNREFNIRRVARPGSSISVAPIVVECEWTEMNRQRLHLQMSGRGSDYDRWVRCARQAVSWPSHDRPE